MWKIGTILRVPHALFGAQPMCQSFSVQLQPLCDFIWKTEENMIYLLGSLVKTRDKKQSCLAHSWSVVSGPASESAALPQPAPSLTNQSHVELADVHVASIC